MLKVLANYYVKMFIDFYFYFFAGTQFLSNKNRAQLGQLSEENYMKKIGKK